MLQPKRTKFRKQMKGRNRGLAHRGSSVSFGEFGLKATERGRLTARQIEAARRAMTRYIKRGGKIWIRVFPDKPFISRKTQNMQPIVWFKRFIYMDSIQKSCHSIASLAKAKRNIY